jgi:hypothetical protein
MMEKLELDGKATTAGAWGQYAPKPRGLGRSVGSVIRPQFENKSFWKAQKS